MCLKTVVVVIFGLVLINFSTARASNTEQTQNDKPQIFYVSDYPASSGNGEMVEVSKACSDPQGIALVRTSSSAQSCDKGADFVALIYPSTGGYEYYLGNSAGRLNSFIPWNLNVETYRELEASFKNDNFRGARLVLKSRAGYFSNPIGEIYILTDQQVSGQKE